MQALVAEEHTSNTSRRTDRTAPLFDWVGLGIFTGHRLGRFEQAILPARSTARAYDLLPINNHIPEEWRGKPKAFVRDDFTFYHHGILLLEQHCLLDPSTKPEFAHIRWRFNKSKFTLSSSNTSVNTVPTSKRILESHTILLLSFICF
jgi:hypothetical protein